MQPHTKCVRTVVICRDLARFAEIPDSWYNRLHLKKKVEWQTTGAISLRQSRTDFNGHVLWNSRINARPLKHPMNGVYGHDAAILGLGQPGLKALTNLQWSFKMRFSKFKMLSCWLKLYIVRVYCSLLQDAVPKKIRHRSLAIQIGDDHCIVFLWSIENVLKCKVMKICDIFCSGTLIIFYERHEFYKWHMPEIFAGKY